jgi:hypothetical protein
MENLDRSLNCMEKRFATLWDKEVLTVLWRTSRPT